MTTDRMLAPAAVVADFVGVPASRLRVWAHRYGIHRERHPETGVLLYDVLDVARVKAATRPERHRRLPRKSRTLV